MTERIFNFSAGPAVLPVPVLEEAQRDMLSLPGVGMSVMEISHRSKTFDEIIARAEAGLRELLKIPDNYHVLFLQGGASLQFSMVPMNFLPADGSADYIITGSWGKKALKEAKKVGAVNVAATMADGGFTRVPSREEMSLDPHAAYVHITSNETIEGVQWKREPNVGDVPLVADASSDILSREIDVDKYALIYAELARKNVRRSVDNEWNVADVWLAFPLHAFDRFIARDVNVSGVRAQTHLVARRHARETAVSHRRGNVHGADFLRFLQRFLAPASGDDVIGAAVSGQEVHRHH